MRQYGGGIELNTWSDLPHGSGKREGGEGNPGGTKHKGWGNLGKKVGPPKNIVDCPSTISHPQLPIHSCPSTIAHLQASVMNTLFIYTCTITVACEKNA